MSQTTTVEPAEAQPGSAPLGGSPALPPLAGELKEILMMLTFNTARIGRRLHELKLYEVPRRVEEEQAAALHWMLNLLAAHGSEWRSAGEKILRSEAQENNDSTETR